MRTKHPLSAEAIVATGLELGDSEGAAAITVRRVAAQLGVTPMALYRHVGGKDGLLDAIVDHVYGQVELPDRGELGWRQGLAAIMRSARTVLLAHPAAAVLVITRPETGPNALRVLDRILGFLDLAGFDPGEAVQVGQAFTRSMLSLVALEATMLPHLGPSEQAELTARASREIEALPPAQLPYLAAAAPYLTGPYDPRRSFEVGLELLNDGIDARLRHARHQHQVT
jgi:AcrR family transcriptional regulator